MELSFRSKPRKSKLLRVRLLAPLFTMAVIFSLLPSQVLSANPGPFGHMSPEEMELNQQELMQGNTAYGIESYFSAAPPDTTLSWAQANLPRVMERNGNYRKDPDKLGVMFSSESTFPPISAIRLQKSKVGEDDSTESILCDGFSDPDCTVSNSKYQSMRIDSVIPPCSIDSSSACVKSFALKLSDGTVVTGSPLTQIPIGAKTFTAKNFSGTGTTYNGSVPWIWSAENKDGASAGYLLRGFIRNYAEKSSSGWVLTKPTFNFEIIPLSLEGTSKISVPPRLEDFPYGKEGFRAVRGVSIQPSCVAHDVGKCFHRSNFPANSRVLLDLKLPNSLSGWVSGRLNKPNVVSEVIDTNFDLVKVEAGAGLDIVAGNWVSWREVPESFFTKSDGSQNDIGYGRLNGAATVYSGDVDALEVYQLWQKYFPDKALIIFPSWTISSTTVDTAQSCAKTKGLQGVVATNASAYSPGAPDFNKESQTLDYKVAAPHFAPDGKTENLGTYGLSMRADLVQCLYGVTEVPSRVEVTITNATNGESKGSTVELFRNGNWVYLSAEGFTYSSPTLKVKLVQEKKVEAAAPATNSTQSNAAVAPKVATKKSISCVKGKIIRKITGTNPKCPTGFKKK